MYDFLNPLSASPTKWSNTLKQFVRNFPTNCLSVFDHFVILVLKGLTAIVKNVQHFLFNFQKRIKKSKYKYFIKVIH